MKITNQWGATVRFEVVFSGGAPPILDQGTIKDGDTHVVPDEVLERDKVYAVSISEGNISPNVSLFTTNNLSQFSDVTIIVTNTIKRVP